MSLNSLMVRICMEIFNGSPSPVPPSPLEIAAQLSMADFSSETVANLATIDAAMKDPIEPSKDVNQNSKKSNKEIKYNKMPKLNSSTSHSPTDLESFSREGLQPFCSLWDLNYHH